MPLSWSVAMVCSLAALGPERKPAEFACVSAKALCAQCQQPHGQLIVEVADQSRQLRRRQPLGDEVVREPAHVGGDDRERLDVVRMSDRLGELPNRQPLQREEFALGYDADNPRDAIVAAHHRDMSDRMLGHQQRCVGRRRIGIERQHVRRHDIAHRCGKRNLRQDHPADQIGASQDAGDVLAGIVRFDDQHRPDMSSLHATEGLAQRGLGRAGQRRAAQQFA